MNNKTSEQKYGVGLEMEGFIVNCERTRERIDGLPASQWVMERVRQTIPELVPYLSFEQASVMLEVKTDVFAEPAEAIRQVMSIRGQIDRLLTEVGCRLVFQPVLREEFEFVPATNDPNSRTHQLIREWGCTPQGIAMLHATAIASLQVNDSRPFRHVLSAPDKLERAREIHNLYSANFDRLRTQNGPQRNSRGMTRMENLLFLLPSVKGETFARHGYDNPLNVALPGHFDDVESMKRWMCAHSDVDNLEDAKCKNEHAVTVKVKRDQDTWIAESRVYDAVDSEQAIADTVAINSRLLEGLEQDKSNHI